MASYDWVLQKLPDLDGTTPLSKLINYICNV